MVSRKEALAGRLPRYFTGKPCLRGHISERFTISSDCIACRHDEDKRQYQRNYNARLKLEVMQHYGGQCACCGETELEFLTIDHLEGNGTRHRKVIKMPMNAWLKQQGFPEGYRVLCFNCNWAIGHLGYCPHKPDNCGL